MSRSRVGKAGHPRNAEAQDAGGESSVEGNEVVSRDICDEIYQEDQAQTLRTRKTLGMQGAELWLPEEVPCFNILLKVLLPRCCYNK